MHQSTVFATTVSSPTLTALISHAVDIYVEDAWGKEVSEEVDCYRAKTDWRLKPLIKQAAEGIVRAESYSNSEGF